MLDDVELVGVQLRQQRQDLVDGEFVVIRDRELDFAVVPLARGRLPLLISGQPFVTLGSGDRGHLRHGGWRHGRQRRGRRRLCRGSADHHVLQLGSRRERRRRAHRNRLRLRYTDGHEQDDGSKRAERPMDT